MKPIEIRTTQTKEEKAKIDEDILCWLEALDIFSSNNRKPSQLTVIIYILLAVGLIIADFFVY